MRWHLTLAFYGEVADAAALGEAIDRRLPRRGPVELRICGGGVFHAGAAHVTVSAPTDENAALLRDLAVACRRAGLACGATGVGRRVRFSPHLTVARIRRGTAAPKEYLDALGAVWTGPWPAEQVELVESFLGPEPRYEVRRRFPLSRL